MFEFVVEQFCWIFEIDLENVDVYNGLKFVYVVLDKEELFEFYVEMYE